LERGIFTKEILVETKLDHSNNDQEKEYSEDNLQVDTTLTTLAMGFSLGHNDDEKAQIFAIIALSTLLEFDKIENDERYIQAKGRLLEEYQEITGNTETSKYIEEKLYSIKKAIYVESIGLSPDEQTGKDQMILIEFFDNNRSLYQDVLSSSTNDIN